MLATDIILQNRYRIVRQLGQGGMGAVYQAVDERLDKTVAIKEILLALETAVSEKQKNLIIKAFQREANSLVKARHQVVPDVTDFFTELERQFLVMEYIEGDDLAEMLKKRNQPFGLEEVLPWINQLLAALKYLHNLTPPIIHRDIKPQNLKLNAWGNIKLLDFGIARSSDKNSTLSQHTFIGATLNYSPFEQVLRVIDPTFREFILLKHRDKAEIFLAQDTDVYCDIFAIGATFYHLLTNVVPVDVTKRALGIWEKETDELADPSEINPEIPASISRWLLKALSFECKDRFATADEMQNALREAIAETRNVPTNPEPPKKPEITREQELMRAKTERLIEADEPRAETEKEIASPPTLPAPTQPSVEVQPSETFSSEEKTPTDFKLSDTDIPVDETSDDLTNEPSVDTDLLTEKEKAGEKVTPPRNEKATIGNGKYILALPLIGLLTFVVGGGGIYGVYSLMNYSARPTANPTFIKNTNTPATPEVTPSVGENTNVPEVNATANTKSTTTDDNPASQTTRPVATPTPKFKITPKPTRTPTPKPTPTPTIDPGCVYTNSC